MAALTALRAEVLPSVRDCPVPVVDNAILKAVIEFCNRSRAYRFTPGDITVVAGTGNYTVSDLPTGTAIAWLLSAELDAKPLEVWDAGGVPKSWDTERGAPSAAVVVSETQLGLRKVPSAAGTLAVLLALRPSLAATTYPDELHNLYQYNIAAGAMARLYEVPNKSWSAPSLVMDCRDKFEAGITAAEYRADRGSASTPARTSLHLVGGR